MSARRQMTLSPPTSCIYRMPAQISLSERSKEVSSEVSCPDSELFFGHRKIIFAAPGTSARNRLLWSCRLVDNEHAYFGVGDGFIRGCDAVPCPDRA